MNKQYNLKKRQKPTISPDILNHPERRLRLPEVMAMTGYCTSSIYAKMANGSFPAAQKMGGRAIAWRLGSILDFMNGRPFTSNIQQGEAA